MFPIGDDNRDIQSAPVVTRVLVGLNVLVFVYELAIGRSLDRFIMAWGAIPYRITHGHDLYTLVSSMFVHAGFAHILGNMLYLWVFGDNVEDRFGRVRFLIFYIVCGLAAGLAQVLLGPGSMVPSIGASGAISGVLGAYIVMFRSNRVRVLWGYFVSEVPAWMVIGFWALQQFIATYATITTANAGESGGVAYAAHAGGFVAGILLALILGGTRRRTERYIA
ncbi:MAG TPA: rhomboid family intramembrane serine protease [Candidatus Kapabacteria bacterium]|nr:rhomboid family intramembrane serine protease [Candidatus Kapabacteria bacterium]